MTKPDQFDLLEVKSMLNWDVKRATLNRLFTTAIAWKGKGSSHFDSAVREVARQAYELGLRDANRPSREASDE